MPFLGKYLFREKGQGTASGILSFWLLFCCFAAAKARKRAKLFLH